MDSLEWVVSRLISISNQMHEVEEETNESPSHVDVAFFAARVDRIIVRLHNLEQKEESNQ